MGYTKNFYGGFAVHHLLQPEERFLQRDNTILPRKFTAHAGWVIPINKRYPKEGSVSPNILYQAQGNVSQLNPNARQLFLGLYARKGPFVGGIWYRNKDAFIVLAGIQAEYVRFGYSYDITSSGLTNRSGGSHEISVAFNFDCRPKRKRYRPIACPKF